MPLQPHSVRHARTLALPEVGAAGQQAISRAHVVVIGAGGLAATLLPYLAAASVKRLTVIDDDVVALSNLPRQTLFEEADLNQSKATTACERLFDLNSEVSYHPIEAKIEASNAHQYLGDATLVVDGCDNFATRDLVAKVCYELRIPLVSAAVMGFSGQLSTFKPYQHAQPCYRCFYPELPPKLASPSCKQSGVFAPVVGVLSSMLAQEILKELCGIGATTVGKMVIYDGLKCELMNLKLTKMPSCPVCSSAKVPQTSPC